MRKILVVEDDKFISAIFTMFIRDLGHELIGKCADGKDAVDLSHRLRPDVVLMDIHLEGEMDGIQTAEQLRRELDIPVIYVSSDTSSQVIKRAIVSNSYGFLVKPVNKKELGIAIDLAYFKHRVDQEQRERERGYRQFISEASMPLMILQDGRIQYLNNLALDLYKTHYMEDVLMMPYVNFVDETDKVRVEGLLQEFSDSGQGFESVDIGMEDVHGQSFCARISGSAIVFNKKKSLQVTLLDNSELVNVKRRANALLDVLASLGQPYFISDRRFRVKTIAQHPLFETINVEKDILKGLPDSIYAVEGDDVISFKEKHTNLVFKAYKIKNTAGDIYETIFVPQLD